MINSTKTDLWHTFCFEIDAHSGWNWRLKLAYSLLTFCNFWTKQWNNLKSKCNEVQMLHMSHTRIQQMLQIANVTYVTNNKCPWRTSVVKRWKAKCYVWQMSHEAKCCQGHRRNVTFSKCHIRQMLYTANITNAKCHIHKMSHKPNITYGKCYKRQISHTPNIPPSHAKYHVPMSHMQSITYAKCPNVVEVKCYIRQMPHTLNLNCVKYHICHHYVTEVKCYTRQMLQIC